MMTLNQVAQVARLAARHFPEIPNFSFHAYREAEIQNSPYRLGSFVLIHADYRLGLAELAVPRRVTYDPRTGFRIPEGRAFWEGIATVKGWILPGMARPVAKLGELPGAYLEEIGGDSESKVRVLLQGRGLRSLDLDVGRRAFLREAKARGFALDSRSTRWLKTGAAWEEDRDWSR